MSRAIPIATAQLDAVLRAIDESSITPHFQPIVDLVTTRPIGYEMLSRGPAPWSSPALLFDRAMALGLEWELERACRAASLTAIAALPADLRRLSFFLNVSPSTLRDERFVSGFTRHMLEEQGLEKDSFVFEITERDSTVGENFEEAIRHYMEQGFKVALDDFGSGHSGLIALIRTTPQFIKLDMEVTRGVDHDPYKQTLVKSVAALADNVNAKLIAEGVETWSELQMLVRQGIRYAQGYLFAVPEPVPPRLPDDVRERIRNVVSRDAALRSSSLERIGLLAVPGRACEVETTRVVSVIESFQKDVDLDHLVVVDEGRPVGLVTREDILMRVGGRYGFSIYEKKWVETASKSRPLIVRHDLPTIELASLAIERPREDLYDPIIVVDEAEQLVGTVTMKQLIERGIQLEVERAQDSNPLTALPGNRSIRRWMLEAQREESFFVAYADLDRFKEYNDRYGFLVGDEMLRLTARLLDRFVRDVSPMSRLGHVGGDDFVLVGTHLPLDGELESLCRRFDLEKMNLFNAEDREKRKMRVTNRQNEQIEIPLTTLSLALIPSEQLDSRRAHPAVLAQAAASLKHKVKEITLSSGRSHFLVERRFHDDVQMELSSGAESEALWRSR